MTPPPDTPAPDAEATPEDPNVIGKVTPEEQAAMMAIRGEQQQLMMKIGEQEFLKTRILARLNELDQKQQEFVNGISQRLGIEDGQQWVAVADGTIRLVERSDPGQTQQGAGPPSG